MAVAVDLRRMSTVEKLRLMEDLWQDLSAGGEEIASPEWHGDVLAERERLTASGEEKFIDWEVAKKQLREELP
ncbi:addiction module protein [Luteolibacter sp. Populi]|uniref:addiction module protein n=1 Tax=Luteolibacter sp. Populi TaxID=3230487 RepID=UPI003466097D